MIYEKGLINTKNIEDKEMTGRLKTKQNHRLDNGVHIREVFIDERGVVLPVVSATRINYEIDRITTYQRPDPKGFVIKAVDQHGVCHLSVNRYQSMYDKVIPVTEDDQLVKDILSRLDPILKCWLTDVVRREMSNLLPAGFGWDGVMTESEYYKHSKIRDLFVASNDWKDDKEKEWFEGIVNEIVKTSTVYIEPSWIAANPIYNNTIPIQRFFEESHVWVVTFDENNIRTIHKVRRIIGSKVMLESTFNVEDNIERVIVLTSGCMLEKGVAYGCGVELYSKKRNDAVSKKRKYQ